MKKLLKSFMISALLITMFSQNVDINSERLQAQEENASEPKLGSFTYDPANIPDGEDGYSFIKVEKLSEDPRTGQKNVPQGYMFDYGDRAWTAYVERGTGTLYVTGDGSNGNRNSPSITHGWDINMGRGDGIQNADALPKNQRMYRPALFNGGTHSGEIVTILGSYYSSLLLTTTGEIWYTGKNEGQKHHPGDEEAVVYEWHKMNLKNVDGKVIDIALANDMIFYITDTGKLYSNGHNEGKFFAKTSLANGESGFQKDRTTELNGEKPKRLFASNTVVATRNGYIQDLVFVETDKGLLASQFSSSENTTYRSGTIRAAGTDRNTNDGFNRVLLQTSDGTVRPVAGGELKDLQFATRNSIVHILLNDGKIYTTGWSMYNNVAGQSCSQTTFNGFGNGQGGSGCTLTDVTNEISANSAGDNRTWDTDVFTENITWGDDNVKIFPGVRTTAVKKSDGNIYANGNIAAMGGLTSSRPDTGGAYNNDNCTDPYQNLV